MRGGWLAGIAAVVMVAASTKEVQAEEYYFSMIFGSQSSSKLLRYTHTWATFVKATGEGPDLRTYALEYNTISRLPQTLEVHVWRLWPEPGVNLDLYQTHEAMYRNRESVTMWGPFVVRGRRKTS